MRSEKSESEQGESDEGEGGVKWCEGGNVARVAKPVGHWLGGLPVVRRCRVMGKLAEGKREERVARTYASQAPCEAAAGVAGSGAKASSTTLPNMASLSFSAATRCTFMATYRPVSRSRTSMTRPYVP